MSSEGSVSLSTLSKIRQFGLYRTVDARTEEFLRLSKKKQIKQGCACAAISTAITVTVVVVTLLIYEYLSGTYTKTESRMNGKEYWQNLMNNSFKIKQKERNERNDLNRFGLDKALNMLPMFLKALKSTKLVDKLVTDPSITTDHSMYETNMRHDIEENNKDTILKLHTLDFKTLPIILFPKTKKNNHIKHNAKERSVKHQRHLDYFYKMIHGRFDHYRPVTEARLENIAENEENVLNGAKQLEYDSNKIKVEHSLQTCRCPNFLESLLNNVSYHLNEVMSVVKSSQLKSIKEKDVTHNPYIKNYEREKTNNLENIIPISNKQLSNNRSLFKVNILSNNNSEGNFILNRNSIISNEKRKLSNLDENFLNEPLKAYVIPMPLYSATTNKLNLSRKYILLKNKTNINTKKYTYDVVKKNNNQTIINLEKNIFNTLSSKNKINAKLIDQIKITTTSDLLQENNTNEDNKNKREKQSYISGENIFMRSTEYPVFTVTSINTNFDNINKEKIKEPSAIFRKLTQDPYKNLTKDSYSLKEVDPISYLTNVPTVTTNDYDYDYYQNDLNEPSVEMFNDNLTLSFNSIPSKIQNKFQLLKSEHTTTEYSLQWRNDEISNEDYLYEEQRKATVDIMSLLIKKNNKQLESKPFALHATEDILRLNINEGTDYRGPVFTTTTEVVDTTFSIDNMTQEKISTRLHYYNYLEKPNNHISKQVHNNNIKEETSEVQKIDDILPVKLGKHKNKESISTDNLIQQENDLLSRYDFLYEEQRKNVVDMLKNHTNENYDTDKVNVPIHLHKLGQFLYPILLESQKYYTTNNISIQNQTNKSHNFRYTDKEIKYENSKTKPKQKITTLYNLHQIFRPKTIVEKNIIISTTDYMPLFKNNANLKNVDEEKRKIDMSMLDKVIYGYYKPLTNTPDELHEFNSLLEPIEVNTTKLEEMVNFSSTNKALNKKNIYPFDKLHNYNKIEELLVKNEELKQEHNAIKSSLKLNNNFSNVTEEETKTTMEFINEVAHESNISVLSQPNFIKKLIIQNGSTDTTTYSTTAYLQNDKLKKFYNFQNNQSNPSANILNEIVNQEDAEGFDRNYLNILSSHNIYHFKKKDKEKPTFGNNALVEQNIIIPYYDLIDKETTFNNEHVQQVSTVTKKSLFHGKNFTTINKSEENITKRSDSDLLYDDNKTSVLFNNNIFDYEVNKISDNEPLEPLKLNQMIPLHEVDTKSYSINIDYDYSMEQNPHILVSSKNKTKHLPNNFKQQHNEKYEVTELSQPTTTKNKLYSMSNSFLYWKTDNIINYDDVHKEEKISDIEDINNYENIKENTDNPMKVIKTSNENAGIKSSTGSTTLNYDYFQDDQSKTTLVTNQEQQKYITPITKTDLVYSEINDIYSDNTPSSEEKYRHVNEDTKRILTTVLYKRPSYLNIQRNEWW